MTFSVKSADTMILSDSAARGAFEEPPPKAISLQVSPKTSENVPNIADMLSSISANVQQIPENVRMALEEERSFKELSPVGIEFVKGLETNPKKKVQQEERMIEFRHVVAQIFKTYDLFSNDVIHAKIRSLSDLLCYHAKKIFRNHCKNRQEMMELRHKVVFTCLSYYLLKRRVIEDNVQQYHILNTIIEASILHTPRRIKAQARKKYSFYY